MTTARAANQGKATAPDYISEHQQRILALIRTLAGQELAGLAPGEIAKLQNCTPSQVTRDLANLKHIGWAEEVPAVANRWRLGPQIVQIALRYSAGIDRAQSRVDEIASRFGRTGG